MSILNTTNITNNLSDQIRFESLMRDLRTSPKVLVDTIFNYWRRAFDLLHEDPATRPAKLNALGTDAKEIFILNAKLCEFLIENLTGKRDDIVSQIQTRLNSLPQFNYAEDGTVTVAE